MTLEALDISGDNDVLPERPGKKKTKVDEGIDATRLSVSQIKKMSDGDFDKLIMPRN